MKNNFFFKRIRLIWAMLFVLFPMFVVSSCEKQSGQFQQTQVSIFLINAKGEKTMQFKQDEIPIVVFEVVNTGEEMKFYPAFHEGEYILLYNEQKSSEPIGNFYSNGQYTNIILPSTFKSNTVTRIQLPWVWTDELKAEIIEYNFDGKEINRFESYFISANNSTLAKGNYRVKLSVPAEWNILVARSEIIFRVD